MKFYGKYLLLLALSGALLLFVNGCARIVNNVIDESAYTPPVIANVQVNLAQGLFSASETYCAGWQGYDVSTQAWYILPGAGNGQQNQIYLSTTAQTDNYTQCRITGFQGLSQDNWQLLPPGTQFCFEITAQAMYQLSNQENTPFSKSTTEIWEYCNGRLTEVSQTTNDSAKQPSALPSR